MACRLISRTGKIKPFIVTGAALLTAGYAVLGTIDSRTSVLFLDVSAQPAAVQEIIRVAYGDATAQTVPLSAAAAVLAVIAAIPLKPVGPRSGLVLAEKSGGAAVPRRRADGDVPREARSTRLPG